MYVAWKVISERLLRRNFNYKCATHLMHGRPLGEEWLFPHFLWAVLGFCLVVWLGFLFWFVCLFPLTVKVEEDGLAHICILTAE